MTVKCKPSQLTLEVAGKVRNQYLCRVPVEHSRDDVLDPLYFGTLAGSDRLTIGDQVECEWEDFSRTIRLQVRGVVPETAQLVTKVLWEVEDDEVGLPDGYRLDWRGVAAGYVILLGDTEVEGGHTTREQAAIRAHILAGKARDLQIAQRAVKSATAKPRGRPRKAESVSTEEAADA